MLPKGSTARAVNRIDDLNGLLSWVRVGVKEAVMKLADRKNLARLIVDEANVQACEVNDKVPPPMRFAFDVEIHITRFFLPWAAVDLDAVCFQCLLRV